jgi:hypothetical protein
MAAGSGMTQTGMATPGAADATTVLRPGRPEDEFPDPYAAPYPASPAGYPPAGSGYGAGGYGAATQVGGYPPAGPPSGYDPATQGYGAPPAGYDRQGGYGGAPTTPQPPQPHRYDDATRHWDAGAAGGYPGDPGAGGAGHVTQPGGYQGGGYDPQAGYGQPTAGYDPYHQQPPNEAPSRRGGRGRDQRLDWLDD